MTLVSDLTTFHVYPAEDDWSTLLASHPNMLVSGPRDATSAFLLSVTPHLRAPVRGSLAGHALLSLPAESGTLMLRDVDGLDDDQQRRLLRWLDEPQNSHTQVISIAATELYTAVQTGAFLEPLYYRLNVIHVQVTMSEVVRLHLSG